MVYSLSIRWLDHQGPIRGRHSDFRPARDAPRRFVDRPPARVSGIGRDTERCDGGWADDAARRSSPPVRTGRYKEHLQHGQPLPLPLQVRHQDPHRQRRVLRDGVRADHDVAPDRVRAGGEDDREQEPPGLVVQPRGLRHDRHEQAPSR